MKFTDYNKLSIGVIGLGYVGLPLLVELSKKLNCIGYDKNLIRLKEIKKFYDRNLQLKKNQLNKIKTSHSIYSLKQCNIYIVTVPTPINKKKLPDLSHLINATQDIGRILKKDNVVIYESTVFPGCTEDICGKILENISGLILNRDFYLGYSPERISPGDKKYSLKNTLKVISGSSSNTIDVLKFIYKGITKKIFVAKSIKIAEAAKVIENTQRDLNIAFINELSKIFSKLKINTYEVLRTAGTKWNFVKFYPGLVGGHCIGVDPYYLTYIAKKNKYNPKVILSGRYINDSMGSYVGKQIVNLIKNNNINTKNAKLLICGLTFKENCPDVRNSKVLDIIYFLNKKNIAVDVYDPWVCHFDDFEKKKYKFRLIKEIKKNYYSGVIFTVAHNKFKVINIDSFRKKLKINNFVYDLKNIFFKDKVDLTL